MLAYNCPIQKHKTYLPALYCRCLKLLFNLLPVFFLTPSFSQAKLPDTASSAALQSVYKQYTAGIGGALNLFSGAEYEGAYPRTLGSPFFNNADFGKGTIGYAGIDYYDVLLAYDLVRNELLVKGLQGLSLRLEKMKVDYFVLGGYRFVHLGEATGKNALPDDFYDLLYDNDVQVYARRSKYIVQSLHAESLDTIVSRTTYFLHKDNAYYSITSADDLLALTGTDKKATKAFWKEAGLNFKKDPESFIIQTLDHWYGLKK